MSLRSYLQALSPAKQSHLPSWAKPSNQSNRIYALSAMRDLIYVISVSEGERLKADLIYVISVSEWERSLFYVILVSEGVLIVQDQKDQIIEIPYIEQDPEFDAIFWEINKVDSLMLMSDIRTYIDQWEANLPNRKSLFFGSHPDRGKTQRNAMWMVLL